MRTRELGKLVNNRGASPEGASAVFVPINDDWAIKFYVCEEACIEAYEMQKHVLEETGLAPKVGSGIVKIEDEFGDDLFGYITEIVETFISHEETANPVNSWYFDDLSRWCNWEESDEFAELGFLETLEKVEAETNLDFCDAHAGNWGYRKDGVPIPIDFY